MKTGKTKKFLAFLVMAVMVASLAACGSEEATGTGSTDATARPETEKKEVVRLEALLLPTSFAGVITGWVGDYLKEKGVELELISCGDQGEQKLQAYIASGELPDVVAFKTYKQVQDAAAAGLLIDLDEHMDKLPDVAANAATALDYVRDQASNGTGKVYTLPTGIGPSDQIMDATVASIQLRWDLYKELGMPPIKTVEDYLPILKQMMELEPKNKDGQKVYGLSLWKDWDSISMYLATSIGMYEGIDNGDKLGALPFLEYNFNTDEGKSLLESDSQYVRALKFFNTAYHMGLVDPDSLTQTFDAARAKYDAGRVLFAGNYWIGSGFNTRENTDADPPKGFKQVLYDEFKGLVGGDNYIGISWCNSISSSTKHLDACLTYTNMLYNPDDLFFLMNGPQGIIWDIGADNVPYVTDQGWDISDNNKELPVPGGGKMVYDLRNMFGLNSSTLYEKYNVPIYRGFWPGSEKKGATKLSEDWTKVTGYKNDMDMINDKKMFTAFPLWQRLIPSVDNSIETIVSQIGDVVKQNSWGMVFAKDQAEFDRLLKDMQDKARTIGIDKVIEEDMRCVKAAKDLAGKYAK